MKCLRYAATLALLAFTSCIYMAEHPHGTPSLGNLSPAETRPTLAVSFSSTYELNGKPYDGENRITQALRNHVMKRLRETGLFASVEEYGDMTNFDLYMQDVTKVTGSAHHWTYRFLSELTFYLLPTWSKAESSTTVTFFDADMTLLGQIPFDVQSESYSSIFLLPIMWKYPMMGTAFRMNDEFVDHILLEAVRMGILDVGGSPGEPSE